MMGHDAWELPGGKGLLSGSEKGEWLEHSRKIILFARFYFILFKLRSL